MEEIVAENCRILKGNVPKTFIKFLSFACIGVFGTLAHCITLITLVEILHMKPVYSTMVGFMA